MNQHNTMQYINSELGVQTLIPPMEVVSETFSETLSQNHSSLEMLHRIGHLTRTLHDNLNGLGISKILEQATVDIPSARDRLKYVACMTEQAAERVLNATDVAIPLQADLLVSTQIMKARWKGISAKASLKSEYDLAAHETLLFLSNTEHKSLESKAILMEIMMAQDFQDLTGQIIKKIIELANDLERQLMQVLIDFSPALSEKEVNSNKNESENSRLNLNAQPVDIVPEVEDASTTSQSQVDDLLDSLGF